MSTSRKVLALALVVPGCAASPAPPESPLARRAASVAFFRYIFAENASGTKGDAGSYCIGFGMASGLNDPPSGFLDALRDARPMVKPASSCKYAEGGVTDRMTGKASLIFNIAAIACPSADRCTITGGYLEGDLSGSSGGYIAERIAQGWRVRSNPNAPVTIS